MLPDQNLNSYKAFQELKLKDEKVLIESLLKDLGTLREQHILIGEQAKIWIEKVRKTPLRTFDIQRILQSFPLDHKQGRSLMALAEAYLRIPDAYTANLLLTDKVADKKEHREGLKKGSLGTLSQWGFELLGYLQHQPLAALMNPLSLRCFTTFMHLLSREFILGQTIEEALKRRLKTPQDRISFDILGEGARTYTIAKAYKNAYMHAIKSIGKQEDSSAAMERDSLSIKLSALHPHYRFSHHKQVMQELVPALTELCILARDEGIALTIDAEETARLEISLDVIKAICESPELKGWDGLGLAVQTYQKCAPALIDWLEALSIKCKMPLMVRLVKGAYWDTEIKVAQGGGYPTYPVFTRKAATDLCYLACAQKLLKAKGALYPQFGTHNAYTVAAILELSKGRKNIEFQRLQGMGEALYKNIRQTHPTLSYRVYAPVGKEEALLPYLVRRLLENGANSSFVHKLYDASIPIDDLMGDPWSFFNSHAPHQHPHIPLPLDLYGKDRKNSQGYDLNDRLVVHELQQNIKKSVPLYGEIQEATLQDLEIALKTTSLHWESWDLTSAEKRAAILNRAANIIEKKRGLFLGLLTKEGKKTLPDAVAELRESVDYCRYYAAESLKHFAMPQVLHGLTGEKNELILRGKGVFACISPWNFPMAIFTGQIVAALAAGNAVIAKPAMLTPLIGFHVIQALYEAGVPKNILHFLLGSSRILGTPLLSDQRVNGVVFTGSTATAQDIQKTLAERGGPIVPFIAETGGLNAMIVDSSALIEQVVDDVLISAFQSAGQRCSSLRILFIQEDIYTPTLEMLKEATEALTVGDPSQLSTDVGPVIDRAAQKKIESYVARHSPLTRTFVHNKKDTFVAPTIIEVKGMEDVKQEVFGPVLHVARFKAQELEDVVRTINQSGYGLTMGLQSRVESTILNVRSIAHVGNLYINRNIIGAVVGIQPFGGENLSGTGPKAGGPYYLPHFAVERTFSYNITASGGNLPLVNLEEDTTPY